MTEDGWSVWMHQWHCKYCKWLNELNTAWATSWLHGHFRCLERSKLWARDRHDQRAWGQQCVVTRTWSVFFDFFDCIQPVGFWSYAPRMSHQASFEDDRAPSSEGIEIFWHDFCTSISLLRVVSHLKPSILLFLHFLAEVQRVAMWWQNLWSLSQASAIQVFWLPLRSTADGTRWYKMGIHGRSAVSKRWFARTFHSKSAASVSTMVLCLSSSVDGWASRSGLISPMPLKVVRNKRCFWSSADKLAPSLVRVTHSVNSYLNQVSKDSWHNQHDQHLVECRWTYWSAALVWLGSKFKTVWAACRGIAGSDLFACRMFGADIFPKADRAQTNPTWSWDALGAGMT